MVLLVTSYSQGLHQLAITIDTANIFHLLIAEGQVISFMVESSVPVWMNIILRRRETVLSKLFMEVGQEDKSFIRNSSALHTLELFPLEVVQQVVEWMFFHPRCSSEEGRFFHSDEAVSRHPNLDQYETLLCLVLVSFQWFPDMSSRGVSSCQEVSLTILQKSSQQTKKGDQKG